jgi:hypothetical protein
MDRNMNTLQCNGCGGLYNDHQADGTLYFHACPDSVPVADRRNENVPDTKIGSDKQIKAAGKGVTPKPGAVVTTPSAL